MDRHTVTGSYTGNGSTAVVIDCAFRPRKVEIYNRTDGDVQCNMVDDGVDGRAYLTKDSGSGTTDLTIVTAPLITSRGFTTGTNADLIENNKVFDYIAFR